MRVQRSSDDGRWRRPRLAGGLLAGALLLILAACTGSAASGGTIYYTNFTAGYVPRSVAAAHPLLVETFGLPGAQLSQSAVTEASVAGLRQSGPAWMPRGYSGNPQDVPKPAYVLRIAYGVPRSFNGQQLCTAGMSATALEAARGPGDAAAIRTIAGLCRAGYAVAYAEGSPGPAPDIYGPGFRAFIGLLGRELMPRNNPVTQDDCIFRNCD